MDAPGVSTGSQTLHVPYVAVAIVVLILAVMFFFSLRFRTSRPRTIISLDDAAQATSSRSGRIRISSGGRGAVSVRGGAGGDLQLLHQLHGVRAAADSGLLGGEYDEPGGTLGVPAWLAGGWFETGKAGVLACSNKGASNLASLGLVCFLVGRFTGAGLLKRFPAHKMVGLYGAMNVLMTFVVFLKLGWVSVACVFLSYFFMSIMFPTIFALGIFGLGARAKRASAYIVMAIMGGAILPKLMGYVGDHFGVARSFIVPTACFAAVAYYGWRWPRFSGSTGLAD